MAPIILFSSGKGSNVQAILDYFRNSDKVNIALIVCNVLNAGVLDIAQKENIPVLMVNNRLDFKNGLFVEKLMGINPQLIVLAGFLWKLPSNVVDQFAGKIINIHPALLPKYGGKGMYGKRVHEAVIAAGEKESGITIHEVNEKYDDGAPLLQVKLDIEAGETAESLAKRIHELEHYYLPKTIEFLIDQKKQ